MQLRGNVAFVVFSRSFCSVWPGLRCRRPASPPENKTRTAASSSNSDKGRRSAVALRSYSNHHHLVKLADQQEEGGHGLVLMLFCVRLKPQWMQVMRRVQRPNSEQVPSPFYPIESEPGYMCVGGAQRSGHGSVGVHQPVSQASHHARVNGGPGDGGSVQLQTLTQQDRDVRGIVGGTLSAAQPHSQDGRRPGGQQLTPCSRWSAGPRGHSNGRCRPAGRDRSVHLHRVFFALFWNFWNWQIAITSIMFPRHSGFPPWQTKGESADGISCKIMLFRVTRVPKLLLKCSPYLGVSERHQGHSHDVLQHAPGGEELLADEDSAAWTQTLIIQSDGNWGDRPDRSGSSQLHTLLLNLKTSSSIWEQVCLGR